MSISRNEMKKYFKIFGFTVDDPNLSLACFKCGEYLYYKSRRYRCDNNHKWRYQEMVFEHADFMNSLTQKLNDDLLCDKT